MPQTNRRELLGIAVASLIGSQVLAAEDPIPAGLSAAERDTIRWGEAASGLQAGLRLLHPRPNYKVGSQIEVTAYIRNRTAAPIRLTYYPAFYEHTPTVIGPDGKPMLVEGVILAGLPTVILVTLPAAETLLVDHPGLWLMPDRSGDRKHPYIQDPKPGRYRVSQGVQFLANPADRKPVRDRGKEVTYPVTFFSEAGRPRRGEALVVPMYQEDADHSLTTGTVEFTVVRTG